MKKFLIVLLLMFGFCSVNVYADDIDLPSTNDLWDNWNSREEGKLVKPVSDADFEKALEQVDKKVNKKKYKQQKKNTPKGEEFSQSNETEIINKQFEEKDIIPVLTVPVDLVVEGGILPVGHYQVKAEREGNEVFIKFYQAQYVMATFPASETVDDFDEDTITFVKWIPVDDENIKVIYGSMDLNAYVVIPIKN